jgi:hypothetical protein
LAVRGSFARGRVRPDESDLQDKAKHWLGRFRRY